MQVQKLLQTVLQGFHAGVGTCVDCWCRACQRGMETFIYICCVAHHTGMATCINCDDSDSIFCISYCATA